MIVVGQDSRELNVSRQTLYWRIGDSNLAGYTNISNQELDSIISVYLANHPNDGERTVIGHLRSSEIFVQRSCVPDSIHRVDRSGRCCTTIKRRVFQVKCGIWTVITKLFDENLSSMVLLMAFPGPLSWWSVPRQLRCLNISFLLPLHMDYHTKFELMVGVKMMFGGTWFSEEVLHRVF